MFPVEFDYATPTSLDEAVALLEQYNGEAKILAGGHSLLPMMKLRLVQPALLIDISRIPHLSGIQEKNGSLCIGALTTEAAICQSSLVQTYCPLLAETAATIGDPQVRNRGTIGGTLAHGDPAADMPAAILVLEGTVVTVGLQGRRRIAAKDLFVDMMTTSLTPDEIITHIEIPAVAPRTGTAYEKFANTASGYAIAGVAALLALDATDVCTEVRIAITGAGSIPTRATTAEQMLKGKQPNENYIEEVALHAAVELQLMSDLHASDEYRAHMARVYTRRALQQALTRIA